jgi:hypothetical protein
MFKHTPRTPGQLSWARWQGATASHTQLAEATITVAVIAYFASFLLGNLLLA